MSCLKILVIYIIAQCYGHHISLRKGLKPQDDGSGVHNIMSHIRGKWIPFGKIEAKSVIRKRESEINGELPLKVEVPPAPVMEHVEEKEDIEAASTLFGFQRPERILNRVPLTRSIAPRLYTNIQGVMKTSNINSPEISPGLPPPEVGEFYEGLPPRPVEPISNAEPIPDISAKGPLLAGTVSPVGPILAEGPFTATGPISATGLISAGAPYLSTRPISAARPIPVTGAIPATSFVAENEIVTILAPPPNNRIVQNNQEAPSPNLFDRFKVRRYAVYAGDVILKHLTQFFNRARITLNRFATPPPPTPEFVN